MLPNSLWALVIPASEVGGRLPSRGSARTLLVELSSPFCFHSLPSWYVLKSQPFIALESTGHFISSSNFRSHQPPYLWSRKGCTSAVSRVRYQLSPLKHAVIRHVVTLWKHFHLFLPHCLAMQCRCRSTGVPSAMSPWKYSTAKQL